MDTPRGARGRRLFGRNCACTVINLRQCFTDENHWRAFLEAFHWNVYALEYSTTRYFPTVAID